MGGEGTTAESAWAPLSHPVFRALWIASLVSNIGTWMQNVGAAWAMTSLSPSPLMVALVQSATSLPVFVVGLRAGAVADIVDRRRLLLVTQTWMLADAALLAVPESDDSGSAELIRHLCRGRERPGADEPVAEEVPDVAAFGAAARGSGHDDGTGLRDGDIREPEGRTSLTRRIFDQVTGEVVRGGLRECRRGKCHHSHEPDDVRDGAVHGNVPAGLARAARMCPGRAPALVQAS